MFLTGDFNAYSEEDPIQVLDGARLHATSSPTDDPDEESLQLLRPVGFARPRLRQRRGPGRRRRRRHLGHQRQRVDRLPVQPLQLQRHRLLRPQHALRLPRTTTRRSSGINAPDVATERRDVQILGTNDFHGRILNNTDARPAPRCWPVRSSSSARTNPDTVFAAAGDLIGASTFESFIQKDKPTIDALNEAGLEVSAAGNHEFDQGYDDLVNRVMAPYDATTNPYGGAEWQYIAANVRKAADDRPALARDLDQGLRRRPGRLRRRGHRAPARAGLARTASPTSRSPTSSTRSTTTADELKAEGADVVVLLVHEGAATTALRLGRPTRRPTSARSSTASTTTSTRSSRATPTWPTTTRSRCRRGSTRVAR